MNESQERAADMAEVMIAYSIGKPIEIKPFGADNWLPCDPATPSWNWEVCNFRIAPPKPKKVKMLCWFDGFALLWCAEGQKPEKFIQEWKRVPSEDKEIEVE